MKKMITGHTRLAGLIGKPTHHSISPLMHTTAFAACGIDAVYLSFDIESEEVAAALEAIKTLSFIGANVTMPHKAAVLPYLDDVSPAARLIGAVNTIVPSDGKLVGHNTDGSGFMRSLQDIGVNPVNHQITILGAGGAATAIITQAALDGVKAIHVYNRKDQFFAKSAEKLQVIAAETGCQIQLFDLEAQADQLSESLADSCLLVNATGVGMAPHTAASALPDFELLKGELAVYDVIYDPRETLLLQEAKARGLKTANGLGMLLYQGAAAFKLWTGKEMPTATIKPLIEAQ